MTNACAKFSIFIITLVLFAGCSKESAPEDLEQGRPYEDPLAMSDDGTSVVDSVGDDDASSEDVPADATLQSAEQAIMANQVDDAQELLEPLIESGDEPVRVRLIQSEIFLEKGDFPGAIHATDVALELDPNNAAAYYQRAQARIGIEEYAEAIADITRFIELTPPGDLRSHAQAQLELWTSILYPDS